MSDDRFITLAIHTWEKAQPVKTLLEREGIEVVLNNVNLSNPVVSPGVRIRIKESDLPLALRIVENVEIFCHPDDIKPLKRHKVLVPVDFSDYSLQASLLAFRLASRLHAEVVLLHSFINPANSANLQLTDSYTYELAEVDTLRRIEDDAKAMMKKFAEELRKRIKTGQIPPVKFTTLVTEGVPEDAIHEWTKANQPVFLVMGTRGADKKGKDLIGSVTAEVLDTTRVAAFTVPETTNLEKKSDLKNVAFFSNLDQEDILALDTLYRIFPDLPLKITIIHIPGRRDRWAQPKKSTKALLEYCKEHYPGYTFTIKDIKIPSIVDDMTKIEEKLDFQLIVVPNKKKNVFARLFNPGLAHKILFHADVPMMVIPV